MQDDAEFLAPALVSRDEASASVPTQEQDPFSTPPKGNLKRLRNVELRTMMRQMTREEVERIPTRRVKETVPKVAEEPHSDALPIGFESADDYSKIAFFDFAKQILVVIA